MKRLVVASLITVLASVGLIAQGSGTPSTLRVITDANGYLLVTAVLQTNPTTQSTFSNTRLRTDANGSLQVVLTGTVTPTYPQSIPASTCSAPSLGESGAATTGIAFTATPSILECIAGSAISTLTGTSRTQTVPLLESSGSESVPSYSFSANTNRGLFNDTSLSGVGITAGGTQVASFISGQFLMTGGASASLPSISFLIDPDTGIWRPGANKLEIVSGTTPVMRFFNSSAQFASTGTFEWSSGSIGGSADVGLARATNSVLGIYAGSSGEAYQMIEMTAPSAPAADNVRVYAVDNAGKTQLCALFSSGAAQCFATQP